VPSHLAATTSHLAGAPCSLLPLLQTHGRKSVFPGSWRPASLVIYPARGWSEPATSTGSIRRCSRSAVVTRVFRPANTAFDARRLLQKVGSRKSTM
jgi:hypothetical protein